MQQSILDKINKHMGTFSAMLKFAIFLICQSYQGITLAKVVNKSKHFQITNTIHMVGYLNLVQDV
jgi:hypothetical protein